VAIDYIDQAGALQPFFKYPPTLQGIQQAIEARKQFATPRQLLVEQLRLQYGKLATGKVKQNLDLLLKENCFTVTTAHQPNLLTGPLYFIYKILHVIRLADYFKISLPAYEFVPVYYMGSEDADLDELGHLYLDGSRIDWKTKQKGAVGRMKVDAEFVRLLDVVEGQLAVQPHGKEIMATIREIFQVGVRIQDATFQLVNFLFAEYGLVVLIPDNEALKRSAIEIFKDDLLHQRPSELVEGVIGKIDAVGYKVQANPRDINLFYLEEGLRERIVHEGGEFRVKNTDKRFTEEGLLRELETHPERFSPNVILRGIFQETILPNIVFVGGGGEIAYWLQYGELFSHYRVPYPVLVLRNSFLVIEQSLLEKLSRAGFGLDDLFLPERELMNRLVARESKNEVRLNGSLVQMEQLYETFKKQAGAVDSSLLRHVDALKVRAFHQLQELEKKMLRAEKRKYADRQRQIQTIRAKLFPGDGLQERQDNMLYFYGKWGREFIDMLYRESLALEQEFVILAVR
jgi:bacillithiol biosynthesis cysteine-adding enzyme BshC